MTQLMVECRGNNYSSIEAFISSLLLEAYSGTQILEQLGNVIMNEFRIKDKQKADIFHKLSVSLEIVLSVNQKLVIILEPRHLSNCSKYY